MTSDKKISRDTAFSLATLEQRLRDAREAIDRAVDEIRRSRDDNESNDEGGGGDSGERAGGG